MKKVLLLLFFICFQPLFATPAKVAIEIHPADDSLIAEYFPGLYLTHVKVEGSTTFFLDFKSYRKVSSLLGGQLKGKLMPNFREVASKKIAALTNAVLGWKTSSNQNTKTSLNGMNDVTLNPNIVFDLVMLQKNILVGKPLPTLKESSKDIEFIEIFGPRLVDLSIKALRDGEVTKGPTVHVLGLKGKKNIYYINKNYENPIKTFFESNDLIIVGTERQHFSQDLFALLKFGFPEEETSGGAAAEPSSNPTDVPSAQATAEESETEESEAETSEEELKELEKTTAKKEEPRKKKKSGLKFW